MYTLRGSYFLSETDIDYPVIDVVLETGKAREAYYNYHFQELAEILVSSEILSRSQISAMQKEANNLFVINALCKAPFSGARYKLIREYPDMIIRGANILKEAVGAEHVDIVIPAKKKEVTAGLRELVFKVPNVELVEIHDRYPVSFENIFADYILNRFKDLSYVPFILPLERLLDAYISVENPELHNVKPLMLSFQGSKELLWVRKDMYISELLEDISINSDHIVVRDSLLYGEPVIDIYKETIGMTDSIFVLKINYAKISACISCGRCCEVCPSKLGFTHSKYVLKKNCGMQRFVLEGCIACGLCSYFCPALR